MDDLPDSLLLEIFRHLPLDELCLGARMVCRRWRAVSHDSELWKYLDVPEHYPDDHTILLLKQVHESVEDIECSKSDNLTKKTFQFMTEVEFPKLRHLCLPSENFKVGQSSNNWTDEIYRSLSKTCPCLEELENITAPLKQNFENGVHEESAPNPAPPDDFTMQPLQIQALFNKLTTVHDKPVYVYGRLSTFASSGAKRKKWLKDLQSLSESCPEVTTYRCRRGQRYMDNDGLENIGKIFPNLTVLELYHTSIDDEGLRLFFAQHKGIVSDLIFDNPGSLTDRGLQTIALNCPKLSYLKLSHVADITNEGVEYLVQRCKNLSELHLNNSIFSFRNEGNEKKCHFNNDCLGAIGRNCPNMFNFRLLNSGEISGPGIKRLADSCRFLTGIMLYECPLVDDACLEILHGMPFLKAAVLVNCHAVTPAGVVHLVLHAPSLLRLTLFVNTEFNTSFFGDHSPIGEKVYSLIDAEHHQFRPSVLRKLIVKGVGGMFLQLLTVLCPDLHTLDLREGVVMNQTAFRYVLINCENLKVLDIQSVANIKDAHLSAIVEFGHNIKRLALGRTVRDLSAVALCEVISSCRSLKYLSMDFNYPIKVPGQDPVVVQDTPTPSETAPSLPPSGAVCNNVAAELENCENRLHALQNDAKLEPCAEPNDNYCGEEDGRNRIDLEVMFVIAQTTHGGLCYLHAVSDESHFPYDSAISVPVQRHIEFHFTPMKYLGSVSSSGE